jgi:hypothetical protein
MDDIQGLIREKAYLIWENEGRPEGRAEHHWQKASEAIAAEQSRRQTKRARPSRAPVKAPRSSSGKKNSKSMA